MSEVLANFVPMLPSLCRWRPKIPEGTFKWFFRERKSTKSWKDSECTFPQSISKFQIQFLGRLIAEMKGWQLPNLQLGIKIAEFLFQMIWFSPGFLRTRNYWVDILMFHSLLWKIYCGKTYKGCLSLGFVLLQQSCSAKEKLCWNHSCKSIQI